MLEVIQRLDSQRQKAQTSLVDNQLNVDERLYENFINKADASLTRAVRAAQPDKLNEFKDGLKDERLKNLLPLYKARNYPKSLDALELKNWEDFCKLKLIDGAESSRAAIFFNRLKELSEASNNQQKAYLLEELQLYGQSIMPAY
jgi:exodeoxyribonuclease-1